ncbi:MAG: transcription antitermination factor NusB [Tannerella sp.]|jgi:N utilization substance protein B|nr:transcription antitermination factor NusB [Tannerella sp.]
MINRVLIRIKVLQMVFAYYQKENNDLKMAENELHLSLRKSYDLYFYLLQLIVELTFLHEQRIDARKHKYLPSVADLNPNMRLVENRFAQQLEKNEMLRRYAGQHSISWKNQKEFVIKILDMILDSDIYTDYLKNPKDSYAVDQEFWRLVFRNLICGNEEIEDALEDICIYWNDDVEIIETFVLKTIKRFNPENGSRQELMPMYKDSEDADFVTRLFRNAIQHEDEYRERINRHTKNWETERIAGMDMVIMQVALSEILNFPKIPTKVTMNEYIDAAKYYSTPKSSFFINGVLDAIVKELKNEKLILKD